MSAPKVGAHSQTPLDPQEKAQHKSEKAVRKKALRYAKFLGDLCELPHKCAVTAGLKFDQAPGYLTLLPLAELQLL